ncbi:efflux RND transporter permease subunit [Vibrio plantisponsor]|jgi:multidrug efflux pump|uniref:Efflux pump membrane transporter n=1 Tax=Vibrio plantisponsor TaxID=664643 RepID=A0ABU4IL05_9VIBR|nr:efflux RND transporter permease subunit [Vibrio plantisponsor]MDW6018542.1 efflux RND transporter permease subunit [Vibrio plantisponsor]NNM42396.1 efflux RND transporter permease subunit [Vibrio plantisponsor]PNH85308.1 hydrophobe/amphiphile efflux-1 family RND transporter [Vibrio diazotrophicus]
MARFFIDRPIFAWVISIIIMLAGVLSIITLPVSQYPDIAPPTVIISGTYPGASADTVENSVTQTIEQNMNGIDNLIYMSSQSSSSGSFSITLTFESGTDADIAQVQVQNKLALAEATLPSEVQQQGITVSKSSSSFLMVVGFVSTDGSMDNTALSDYMISNVKDPLSRVQGVGEVQVFGAQNAMRIWLDPNKLNKYSLTPTQVKSAISAQNTQVSVGQLGAAPSVKGQRLNATITAQSRMRTVSEFENILLRVDTDGAQIRLKDVARVELGAESYQAVALYNGKYAAGIAIKLATGANALDTSKLVKARINEMSPTFPDNIEVIYPYDTTPFVQISIEEVVHTLIEAIVLVFLVMYLFLQNFRATLIPTIAVPVVLLGTFGVMAAFGFSINTLTMFGLVLAIGLLVDDAIVVVENVERVMAEDGLAPREATRKSMGQITGALVGIAMVLSAVFIPMAFFGGAAGAIYRQFSLTIVSSMVLSVIVAMVLTPALCATLLKPMHKGEHHVRRGPLAWFNKAFDRGTNGYKNVVSKGVNQRIRYLAMYVIIVGVLGTLWTRLPTSFVPEEDQGIFLSIIQLPAGATQEQTLNVMDKVEKHFMENESDSVQSVFTVSGFSFAGQGQNMGMAFIRLKDWDERTNPAMSVNAIVGRAWGAFSQVKEANIYTFNVPAIMGLGNATGFDAYITDNANLGHDKLIQARNQLLGMASQNPNLTGVRPNGMEDTPQFRINIDYEKAMAMGLSVSDINSTLSTALGSSYVNDFIDNGRVKKVYVQADAEYRMNPEDLRLWHVKNNLGEMVPFDAFATTDWTYGSPRLERYNGVPAVNIQGSAAAGKSTGDAMQAISDIVAQLPQGIGLQWTGASYQEVQTGSQAPLLYALSILIVFLSLAALYESWSVPFSVIMIVPLGVFGAIAAATMKSLSNDIYFQVGLLTTIGLSAKNAILIVEFAKALYDEGEDLIKATVEACRMRLRPIMMTSFAFILGVLPLALSTGAGAASRNAIGWGVVGGMFAATILAIFFVPVFFVIVMKLFRTQPHKIPEDA